MTIGIVGAGQLGRMMALAGYPLGLQCLFLDRSPDTPAGQLAPTLVGELTDQALLRELAQRSEVLSFDWENVSVDALRAATRGLRTRIAPPLKALAVAQDRLSEKRLFKRLRIPTTRFATVDSAADLQAAMQQIGLPGVLKTRRLGYDGKGQCVVRSGRDAATAWQQLGGAALLYEQFIPFDFEVSIIGVRDRRGEVACYPLCRNRHHQGILRLTTAPFADAKLRRRAESCLRAVMTDLNYVGVLTIEFFVRAGQLLANEMAPRVHNSGHWTIEGAETSQFENHLRAICGLPLGATTPRGHSGMINLIGRVPPRAQLLQRPDLHLHDYGKTPRRNRKVGHLTLLAASARLRDVRIHAILRHVYPALTAIL